MKHDDTIADYVQCSRNSEIQDGSHQTGTAYISACRQDNNVIPTAIPLSSGSGNTTFLLCTPSDVNGSVKSKMAAAKPEEPITQLVEKIAMYYKWPLPRYLGQALQYCSECDQMYSEV